MPGAGAVHHINLDTVGRGDAAIHVRYASNSDKAPSHSETSRCAISRHTQRSKIHALETLDALLCDRAIPMQRRASNDIGASRGARERVRESNSALEDAPA